VPLQIGGELLQRYLGDNDLVAPETYVDLDGLRVFLHLCRHLDFLWLDTPGFFLWRIARQLIDHKGLRVQIAPQREALTVGVECELTGKVAVAYQGLEVGERPCRTVPHQATLKAVGWQRRDGDGQEGRQPSGVGPLHGKLDPKVRMLWPLAEGTVNPGARFS
jgi:hypothetical protein